MRIAFFDFETTGLDTQTANVIELAVSSYTDSGKREGGFECKIWDESYGTIPEEVVSLTGITQDECMRWGIGQRDAFHVLGQFIANCDALCAHNGIRYDFKILQRLGFDLSSKILIDTRVDIRFKPGISSSRKLVHLCAEHGIPPLPAHSAVFDVESMALLFFKYDVKEIIARAQTPLLYIRAGVSKELKDRAKSRGYFWDFKKMVWYKQIRAYDSDYEREQADGQFPIYKLDDDYAPPEG